LSTKTYNPKKVIITFGGVEIKGFTEDSIIEVEPLGEGTKSVIGCDGGVTRSIDPDTRCKVTVKLKASSSSNDYLSTIYAADQSTGGGILPISMKDLSGTTTFAATQAWVTNYPKVSREKEAKENEWVFETGAATLFVGGNS